jgi:hypothetical protein
MHLYMNIYVCRYVYKKYIYVYIYISIQGISNKPKEGVHGYM